MVAFLTDWRRCIVDGGLMFVARDPKLGVIRIRTGMPLRPIRQVVAEMVRGGIAGAPFEERAPPRRFATAEGEYAALFEFVALAHGLEIRRTFAVLIGDSELVTLDGRAVRPEGHDITEKVQALASSFALGLGSDRWRRFFYQPPPGWHRLRRFHADVWLAPDYPKNSGTITAFHARLLEPHASALQHAKIFEDLSAEYGRSEPLERRTLAVPSGLAGELMTFRAKLEGRTWLATNVALTDRRTLYSLRLETDQEHARDNAPVFAGVVSSVEGLPATRHAGEPFAQWTE